MLSNDRFQRIIEGFHPELRLTVNNNEENLGALNYRGRLYSPVPRNYFPKDDVWEQDGMMIKYTGLRTVVQELFRFGREHGHYGWFQKWQSICREFDLNPMEELSLMVEKA